MHESRWLAGTAALLLAACAAQKASHVKPAAAKPPHAASATKAPGTKTEKPLAALAPGEVGYYLDVLQGRLQQSVDPAVIVGRASNNIVLDFSRRLGFAAGGTELDDADRALLAPLSKVLAEYRMTQVSVRVSADEGTATARNLAQQRASAITHVLEESGIAAARIKTGVPDATARDGDAHVEIELEPVTRGE